MGASCLASIASQCSPSNSMMLPGMPTHFPEDRSKPLQGIKVIEIGQVLAGPFAGMILSDLGADVLKVERVDGGDDTRRMGQPFHDGDALNFHSFNRGKRSVAINLKTQAGLEWLDGACRDADILIHNLRPGVASALRITGQDLCSKHPRLIYCEISAFGHVGPLRNRPGYEPLVQAFSGLSSINGAPDSSPTRIGASVCDQGTGMWVAIGALALLEERRRTGLGGILNASLLETAMLWAGQKVDAYVNKGELPVRHASGHPDMAPYEAFDASDGPLIICAGNDRLFGKLAIALGHPEWVDDPLYKTNRRRVDHRDELFATISKLLAEKPRDHWLDVLESAGVPCAPIHSIPEAVSHRHIKELGIVQAVPGHDFRLVALPLAFNGKRPQIAGAGPRFDAETCEPAGFDAWSRHAYEGGRENG